VDHTLHLADNDVLNPLCAVAPQTCRPSGRRQAIGYGGHLLHFGQSSPLGVVLCLPSQSVGTNSFDHCFVVWRRQLPEKTRCTHYIRREMTMKKLCVALLLSTALAAPAAAQEETSCADFTAMDAAAQEGAVSMMISPVGGDTAAPAADAAPATDTAPATDSAPAADAAATATGDVAAMSAEGMAAFEAMTPEELAALDVQSVIDACTAHPDLSVQAALGMEMGVTP
jgi:hypothetical protein